MSIYRENLSQKFKEEYDKLNDQQKKAVDTIEGPVMVIAGPGTGKTQILASRIGKILLETDASPSNILCLTYTDAGVVAMRRRLLQFIGPDAYKVNIYTFHAFCNDIIQENLPYFEKHILDPISELETIEIYKELIDALPKNNPLKRYRGDVYYEINNLKKLFADMKKEGWTPEFLHGHIDSYISSIPTREGFYYKNNYRQYKKGDLKEEKIREETERMEKLRAAVNEFPRFQEMMRKRNRYDFDDMINWVIKAFEENPALLANYQERYQYILVDEYQDTSGTQNRLVELLISFWDSPNVFVVGDDDQSIFRFQGANVFNMAQFANSYGDAMLKVILTNNYRSTQPILDISKSLIERNQERLVNSMPGLTKELISSNSKISSLTHQPIIAQYETPEQEMVGIANTVRKLILEGVAPGRIGIIYRENKYGLELTKYFRQMDIPVYSKRRVDLLTIPLVQKIILIFRYLNAEHYIPFSGDEMLFEMLHAQWFGIEPIEIAKLSIEAANRSIAGNPTSIRQLITEKTNAPAKDLFSVSVDPALEKASKIIESLIADVSNQTVQQLFESVVRKTGILSSIMSSPGKHWDLTVLTALFNFIRTETQRNPLMQLRDLVAVIDLMMDEQIQIPLIQVSGSDKAVNLMTAHGSKGLEFEYVFIAGSNANIWEKKKNNSKGYKLPDSMLSNTGATDEEELRRLFYVALTRAEQHLSISFSQFNSDGKELEPSVFIAEILDKHEIPIQKIIPDESVMDEFAVLMLTEARAPEISRIEKEFVDGLLEKFVMNATALNNYLKCPLEFYYKNLVRIPSPKNESLEFGSAIHYALEQLFRKMSGESMNPETRTAAKQEFPSSGEFLGFFEWYMKRHRESFTQEQYNRRMEYGLEVLSNYYTTYISQFHKIVVIEYNIRNVVVEGVPIKGKLDKIEFYGKKARVVDYKTGDPDKAKKKLQPPNDKQPDGGDYWRQAVFYKILVENFRSREWTVDSAEFDFVEPNAKKEYVKAAVEIGPADVATVKHQIKQVWDKIHAHEFYTGCGEDDCHWCNFVKNNSLAIAMHEIPEEEE